MDRGTVLLTNLRNQLSGWHSHIQRATCATRIDVVSHNEGEFTLRVVWVLKDGTEQHFDRMFTRQEMFGQSYGGSPLGWRVQRKACDYARDVMRQVLAARGAL